MIHDKIGVDALRACVAAQLDLIKSLEAKVVKGKLDALEVARHQTEDIETFFLRDLERQDRTRPKRPDGFPTLNISSRHGGHISEMSKSGSTNMGVPASRSSAGEQAPCPSPLFHCTIWNSLLVR